MAEPKKHHLVKLISTVVVVWSGLRRPKMETKKDHLVKLVSTVVVGWFEETKAHLVVYICGSLK